MSDQIVPLSTPSSQQFNIFSDELISEIGEWFLSLDNKVDVSVEEVAEVFEVRVYDVICNNVLTRINRIYPGASSVEKLQWLSSIPSMKWFVDRTGTDNTIVVCLRRTEQVKLASTKQTAAHVFKMATIQEYFDSLPVGTEVSLFSIAEALGFNEEYLRRSCVLNKLNEEYADTSAIVKVTLPGNKKPTTMLRKTGTAEEQAQVDRERRRNMTDKQRRFMNYAMDRY